MDHNMMNDMTTQGMGNMHNMNGDGGNMNMPPSHHGGTGGAGAYFYASVDSIILFEQWVTSTWQTLLIACVGVFFLAIMYEGLKVGRERLALYSAKKVQNHNCCSLMCSCHHVFQSMLHVVQVVISYLLMLIFMTFNVYLCVALALGAGVGYFVFGWKARRSGFEDHCN